MNFYWVEFLKFFFFCWLFRWFISQSRWFTGWDKYHRNCYKCAGTSNSEQYSIGQSCPVPVACTACIHSTCTSAAAGTARRADGHSSSTTTTAYASALSSRFHHPSSRSGQNSFRNCCQFFRSQPEEVETKVSAQAAYYQVPRVQGTAQCSKAAASHAFGCRDIVRAAFATAATLPPVATRVAT